MELADIPRSWSPIVRIVAVAMGVAAIFVGAFVFAYAFQAHEEGSWDFPRFAQASAVVVVGCLAFGLLGLTLGYVVIVAALSARRRVLTLIVPPLRVLAGAMVLLSVASVALGYYVAPLCPLVTAAVWYMFDAPVRNRLNAQFPGWLRRIEPLDRTWRRSKRTRPNG